MNFPNAWDMLHVSYIYICAALLARIVSVDCLEFSDRLDIIENRVYAAKFFLKVPFAWLF